MPPSEFSWRKTLVAAADWSDYDSANKVPRAAEEEGDLCKLGAPRNDRFFGAAQ